MLSLKVFIQTQQKNTTMRFNQDMSVAEVCKQIREKFVEGGADHGLFQPAVPGKNPARWLRPERTLQYYDLHSADEVHYRKRHRPIKVRLPDGATRTMLIDDSLTVMEITDVIGLKIDLKSAEEYSLQSETQPGVWLNPTLSLHENGVPEDAVIILSKKLSWDDANVDCTNPMQLHMLFSHCQSAGVMPTHREEAIQLAALMCQVLYGNHDPAKHKKNWLDLTKVVGAAWIKKVKEEEIYREHKKLVGMTEANAKYRYVQLCRSLKTYGVTLFDVKEKKKGTKKLLPLYLGINRDSIMRMNHETKEIEKQWPLTHLRRWAASDKTFTLDFGEYEGDYISLDTVEGEAISQLIGAYIDMWLRRHKQMGRIEQEDDSVMASEELLAPIRAAAVSTQTSHIGLTGDAMQQGREGLLAPGQQVASIGGVGGPQSLGGRGVQVSANKQGVPGSAVPITDVPSALEACNLLITDLQNPQAAVLSPGDVAPEEWRKQLVANANAVGRSALELLAQASKQTVDKTTLDGLGKSLGLSVQAMVNAARHAATGSEDDVSLLLGARAVSEAVAELLKCAKDISDSPNNQGARDAMRHAAEALKAAQIFLASAQQGSVADQASQDLVLESAKAVAAAASELVAATYDGARSVADQPKKVALTAAGKGTAAATNNLVTIAKAIAPGLSAQQVRQHFVELGKALEGQCGQLSSLFKGAVSDAAFLDRMAIAARDVNTAIAQMALASEALADGEPNPRDFSLAAAAIQGHVAMLSNAQGNPQTIRQNTLGINEHTPKLLHAARLVAPALDSETARCLMNAARQLADATARLGHSSREAIARPKDEAAQQAVVNVAKRLQEHASEMVSEGGRVAALMALRHAAKRAAADATALVAASKGSLGALGPQDNAVRNALKKATGDTQDALARLLAHVAAAARAPGDASAQASLVEQSKASAAAGLAHAAHSKRAALRLQDPAAKRELLKAADAASAALHELLDAAKTAEEVGQSAELTQAIEALMALEAELDVAETDPAAAAGAAHGQTRDNALELLALAAKHFDKSGRDLVAAAAADADAVGPAAKQSADATGQLVAAAKSVAATSADKTNQKRVLHAAKLVAQEAAAALHDASRLQQTPGDAAATARLQAAVERSAQAAKELLSAAVGLNAGELEEICDAVSREAARVAVGTAPAEGSAHVEELQAAAKALASSVSSVVAAARVNPKGLGAAAKMAALTVSPLVDSASAAASANKDRKAQAAIAGEARAVVCETALLLHAAKEVAVSGASADAALANASQAVGDALARLLHAAAPGKREVSEAQALLHAAQTTLADPSARCQGTLADLSRATARLAEAVQATVAVRTNPEKLGENAKSAAQAVATIVDASKALQGGSDGVSAEVAAPVNAILADLRTLRAAAAHTDALVTAAKNVAASSARLNRAVKGLAPELAPDACNALVGATQALALTAAELVRVAKEAAAKGQVAVPAVAQTTALVEEAAKRVLGAAPAAATERLPKEAARELNNATRAVADSAAVLVSYSAAAVAKPADAAAQAGLSAATASVGEAIAQLTAAAASLQPGVKECDAALECIGAAQTDIDGALLAVAVGSVLPQAAPGKSHQDCQEGVVAAARELSATIQKTVGARNNVADLAAAATEAGAGVRRLAAQIRDAAATTTNQRRQVDTLKTAKELVAAMHALVASARGVAANQSDAKRSQDVVASSQAASAAIQQLVAFLKSQVVSYRDLDAALDAVREALAELAGPLPAAEGRHYGQCRQELTRLCRDVAMSVSNLSNAAKANVEGVGAAGKAVGQLVRRITGVARVAAAVTADGEARAGLVASCRDLDAQIGALVESAKLLTANQRNAAALQRLAQQHQAVSEAVTSLLSAAKQGAIGERETEQAVEEIGAVVGDLDTAALFAAAGQLDVELPPAASYQASEAELFAATKSVADAAAAVTASALGSMEQLGTAAKSLAAATAAQAKAIKETAVQIPDIVVQQDLLAHAKACAAAAQQVVAAAQALSERPADAGLQQALAGAGERVQRTTERLARRTETAAAEAAKGVRELERAQQEIAAALKLFDTTAPAKLAAPTPNDVIEAARAISAANAGVVSSTGGSQEDVARAAKEACDACVAILDTTKAANAKLADKASTKDALKKSAKEAVQATVRLLDAVKTASAATGKRAAEAQVQASQISEEVVARIYAYVDAARLLPSAGKLKLEKDFGEDLDEVAERELRAAAAIIERAAASLLSSRAREAGAEASFDLDIDITDAILDAARAIALATGTLVKAAAGAQRERVAAGRDPKTKHLYKKDATWASGLISAAQTVAATTQHLVTTANKTAKHEEGGDEDHLMACAKAVAAATAQLVAASKAKADPSSPTQRLLMDAAKSVAKATGDLVNTAKYVTEEKKQKEATKASRTLHPTKISEIETQARIIALERQLQEARQELADSRRKQYADSRKA